jgi:hypothetical protein
LGAIYRAGALACTANMHRNKSLTHSYLKNPLAKAPINMDGKTSVGLKLKSVRTKFCAYDLFLGGQ